MVAGARAAHFLRLPQRPRRPLSSFLRHRCNLSSSSAAISPSPEDLHDKCEKFLPWLCMKSGCEISSVLAVGFSTYGRSLFASKAIQAGDSILKVPYSVQITQDNLTPEVKDFLAHSVGDVSKLAIFILREKKLGWDSEWAPYINSLPSIYEMHNTIFWSDDELDMIRQSPLYLETLNQRTYLEKEFLTIKPVLDYLREDYGETRLKDFMHAYALDFLNHNGLSEAVLLSDEGKEISEVIADRDYVIGEEVFIRYGKFPNAKLLMDFGFTVPYNTYDQVEISMGLDPEDPLYRSKLELLQKHCFFTSSDTKRFTSVVPFNIKEVKSTSGKGIPQAFRAFGRVSSATSEEELKAMAVEAAENDGRLARRALKNKARELQAHLMLLSHLKVMIQGHSAAIQQLLRSPSSSAQSCTDSVRKKMARDLLAGELRVLKSATTWLSSYCTNL